MGRGGDELTSCFVSPRLQLIPSSIVVPELFLESGRGIPLLVILERSDVWLICCSVSYRSEGRRGEKEGKLNFSDAFPFTSRMLDQDGLDHSSSLLLYNNLLCPDGIDSWDRLLVDCSNRCLAGWSELGW